MIYWIYVYSFRHWARHFLPNIFVFLQMEKAFHVATDHSPLMWNMSSGLGSVASDI